MVGFRLLQIIYLYKGVFVIDISRYLFGRETDLVHIFKSLNVRINHYKQMS